MELTLIDAKGQATASVKASDELFGREYNESLVHQVVTAYMANARMGTRAQKGRSDIAKSTRKPWRQKGTGRARAGMASSPLWRGGGKIFPNGPEENFSQKVNRKMFRAGLSAILSQLARDGRLAVVEDFSLDSPKTRLLAQKVREMGMHNVLIITDKLDENLMLSARNLPNILVIDAKQADPVSLLRFEKTLITKGAVAKIEEMLA
ncbi:MAG TPA: 50S ribosomal protein L4 [Rhodanobacteraceae bacterium]|nr:50S ribosomal protein L4 [Rhodanobacteraceae bacterium]